MIEQTVGDLQTSSVDQTYPSTHASEIDTKVQAIFAQHLHGFIKEIQDASSHLQKGDTVKASVILSKLQEYMGELLVDPQFLQTQVERVKEAKDIDVRGATVLLGLKRQQSIHPFQASREKEELMVFILKRFVEQFKQTPEHERKELVHKPFFPERTFFGEDEQLSFHTATPLFYATVRGDINLLKMIEPYLDAKDFLVQGPHGYSLLHVLLKGMAQEVSSGGESALKCFQLFLEKAPDLATRATVYGTTPLQYADMILHSLANMRNAYQALGKVFQDERAYVPTLIQFMKILTSEIKK
jgi:hypothetical protein